MMEVCGWKGRDDALNSETLNKLAAVYGEVQHLT